MLLSWEKERDRLRECDSKYHITSYNNFLIIDMLFCTWCTLLNNFTASKSSMNSGNAEVLR